MRVIAHEIGHAIGLFHEQMRHDRDKYVTVHKGNIMDRYERQFDVMKQDEYKDFSKPYDYLSIMHYGKLVSVLLKIYIYIYPFVKWINPSVIKSYHFCETISDRIIFVIL